MKGRLKMAERDLIPMNKRSPEERKRISQLGVEARKQKAKERKTLQMCMRELLSMNIEAHTKKAELLKRYGFTNDELNNKNLLMVALFQKGLTGDVGAIKQIVDMMDKLDMFERTGKVQNQVTINLVTQGETYVQSEEVEREIRAVESGNSDDDIEWIEETNDNEDDWGNDIYNG